ncbi:hypothetical protein ABSA28_00984 [Candidatus Hepatincolaceae symbiont of Richtersius coronifer]
MQLSIKKSPACLKIFTLSVILLSLSACFSLNPKPKINTLLGINALTSDVKTSLQAHDFLFLPKPSNHNSLVFYHEDYPSISITLFSESNLNYINGVFITMPFDDKHKNPDSLSRQIINNKVLNLIKGALKDLPCNDDINFLRNEFSCLSNYTVNYEIFEDKLNSIRGVLKIKPNRQISINISPS